MLAGSIAEIAAIRGAALVAAVLLAAFMPTPLFVLAAFVLGQAHFMLAYWYQADAGKWDMRRLAYAIAFFALLLFALGKLPLLVFVFITALVFAVHHAFDEVFLLGGKLSWFTTLESSPFLLLYAALLSDAFFMTSWFMAALFLSGALLALYALLSYLRGRRPDRVSVAYFALGGIALLAYLLHLMAGGIEPASWFLGLTVLHYGLWYGEYWRKLKSKPERRPQYLKRVFALNAALILAGILYLIFALPPLGILFAPGLFYVWAFMHIVTSVRLSDLRAAFRIA